MKIYGYSSVTAGAIALSDNSEIDRDNFADASLVAGITFATVSSSSNSSSASSDEAVMSNVISKISTKIPGMRSSNLLYAPAISFH